MYCIPLVITWEAVMREFLTIGTKVRLPGFKSRFNIYILWKLKQITYICVFFSPSYVKNTVFTHKKVIIIQ